MPIARFRFYGELNDFLPQNRKKQEFSLEFKGTPSVKDTVEALGVPHPEIDLLLMNGSPANFHCLLRNGDRVAVYPVFQSLNIESPVSWNGESDEPPRFILDTQLGRLAKGLRWLGFDTLYQKRWLADALLDVAESDTRVILTRDVNLLKRKRVTRGYWVRAIHGDDQVVEVLRRFGLKRHIHPFHRCTCCNGRVQSVQKKEIQNRIKLQTRLSFDEFYQCEECHQIYWKGSHFDRMVRKIDEWIKRAEGRD